MYQVIFTRPHDAVRSRFFDDETEAKRYGASVMKEQQRERATMVQGRKAGELAKFSPWVKFWVEPVPTTL